MTRSPPLAYRAFQAAALFWHARLLMALPEEEPRSGNVCTEEARGGTTGCTCLLQRKSTLATVAPSADLLSIEDAHLTRDDRGSKEAMNEQNEWLAEVNLYRCMHGVAPLVWSEALAASVRGWVGGLSSPRHSDSYHHGSPLGPSGENLAWGQDSIARAVYDWYSDVAYCSSLPGCEEGLGGAATGHFTTLVWRSSTELGCGRSSRTGFLACRFRGGREHTGDASNLTSAHLANVRPKSRDMQACLATTAGEADIPTGLVGDPGLEDVSTTRL